MSKTSHALSNFGWMRNSRVAPPQESFVVDVVDHIKHSDIAYFWATNSQHEFTDFSIPALSVLGVSLDLVIGKKIMAVFEDAPDDGEFTPQRSLSLKTNARSKVSDHIVRIADGITTKGDIWLLINARPLFENDIFKGYFGTAAVVTGLVAERQKKLVQEKFDPLTNMQNAGHFSKRFTSLFAGLSYAQRPCALMTIDIDQFGLVNERHGTATADALLAEFSNRLRNLVGEAGEVGRVGSDQFRIFFADKEDRGELGELAAQFDQTLSLPYRVGGRRIHVTFSVGIAIAPYDAVEAHELVDASNLALLAAKQSGGGRYCLFSPELAAEAMRERMISKELEGALSRGEFSYRYAPLIHAPNCELRCLRAELQWRHAEIGVVPIATFWPMIESSEACAAIGEWMIKQACSDASQWPEPVGLSIQLPTPFLKNPNFQQIFVAATDENGINRSRIEIEVSAEFIASDFGSSAKLIRDIAAVGAKSVLCGFGEGTTAITALADLELDRVDIAPTFAASWVSDKKRADAILGGLCGLAKTFGLKASIRGIDALDVLSALNSSEIDLVEGPIFSKPLEQQEVLDAGPEIIFKFKPEGPQNQRAERFAAHRKIGLVHDDHYYDVVLKNVSKTGAKIAGASDIPVGVDVVIDLGNGQLAVARVVNSDESGQGLKFEIPLISDGYGGLVTRRRISPYALAPYAPAEESKPVGVLGSDFEALKALKNKNDSSTDPVQLQPDDL